MPVALSQPPGLEMGAVAATSAPRALPAGGVRAVPPAVMLPPSLPLLLPTPHASQRGLLSPSGVPVGAVGPSTAQLLPFSLEGVRLAAPAIDHSARVMTAGEASAAAISRDTMMRAAGASTNRSAGASNIRGGSGSRSGAAEVEGVEGVEGASGSVEVVTGEEPHEEEIIDLWEIIGSDEKE